MLDGILGVHGFWRFERECFQVTQNFVSMVTYKVM